MAEGEWKMCFDESPVLPLPHDTTAAAAAHLLPLHWVILKWELVPHTSLNLYINISFFVLINSWGAADHQEAKNLCAPTSNIYE